MPKMIWKISNILCLCHHIKFNTFMTSKTRLFMTYILFLEFVLKVQTLLVWPDFFLSKLSFLGFVCEFSQSWLGVLPVFYVFYIKDQVIYDVYCFFTQIAQLHSICIEVNGIRYMGKIRAVLDIHSILRFNY